MRVKIISMAVESSFEELERLINDFCKTVHTHDIVIDWYAKFVYVTYWEEEVK